MLLKRLREVQPRAARIPFSTVLPAQANAFQADLLGDSPGKRKKQLRLCGRAREGFLKGALGMTQVWRKVRCLLPPFRLAESGARITNRPRGT